MSRAFVLVVLVGLGLTAVCCGGHDEPTVGGEGEGEAGEGEGEAGEGEGEAGEGEGEAGEGEGEVEPRCGPDGVVPGDDDTVVETQADVEALAGCTEIEGSLVIRGHEVVDLGPLSTLVRIGRGLQVLGAIALRSLVGLDGITTIGWGVEVAGCDSLETLEGLGAIESVGWRLEVTSCASLEKLDGIDALTGVGGGVSVMGNANLTSIEALAGLEVGEGFEGTYPVDVRWNPSLRTLRGLEFLGSGGPTIGLGVSNCDVLDDLDALAGLEEVRGLELRDNPSIVSLEALSALRAAGAIRIEGLGVISLAGLDGLTTVGWLTVEANPVLTDLSALGSLEEVGELHVGRNMAMWTLGELQPLTSLHVVSIVDNPVLVSLGPNLLGSGALERLYLGGCPALVDLAALAQVDAVDDQFSVIDLDSLASLSPLDAIASVGQHLTIIHNDVLPQLDAEAWADPRGAEDTKVDGNLGAKPHLDSCPWTDDLECDEQAGTGLCPDGSDFVDCNWND